MRITAETQNMIIRTASIGLAAAVQKLGWGHSTALLLIMKKPGFLSFAIS
jgi:hypothetical protein